MQLRIAALGGFGPSQARPQQAPLDGATLVVVMASGAAPLAAWEPPLTPDGAALVALVLLLKHLFILNIYKSRDIFAIS